MMKCLLDMDLSTVDFSLPLVFFSLTVSASKADLSAAAGLRHAMMANARHALGP